MSLHFDLKQLNSFLTIAELGNFSRAAEQLCIAQSALSRQIRLLEEELGAQLFVRHGRGVVTTAAGELLIEKARSLMDDANRLKDQIAQTEGKVTGVVRLGLISSLTHGLMASILTHFKRLYPEVQLIIEQAMSGSLKEMTVQNRVDLALIYAPSNPRNLHCTPLIDEKLYLVGPASSDISNHTSINLKQALNFEMALPARNHGLRITIEEHATKLGQPLIIDTEVNSLSLQLELVRMGTAHTILPLATIKEQLQSGELTAIPINRPYLSRRLVLASPADRPASVACRKLQSVIFSELKRQANNEEWPGIKII